MHRIEFADAVGGFEAALGAHTPEERHARLARSCEPGIVLLAGDAEAAGPEDAASLLGFIAGMFAPGGGVRVERRGVPEQRGLTLKVHYSIRGGTSDAAVHALVLCDRGPSGRLARVSLFLEEGSA